ncbi:hypothetical protein PR048_022064 [Dryococelus australis]|uniref:Uncharacterized protein n=1 Tax=Dryococelus australis TaxID=614101 RepID=A0ABQ9GZY6_9NEOP|nr:hypothetical protein PR048_022064 [Dryococelus australis]
MFRSLGERGGVHEPLKRIKLSAKYSRDIKIEDFVTKNTMTFFHRLNIPVVNDHVERGVELMQAYSALIMKNEAQEQYL